MHNFMKIVFISILLFANNTSSFKLFGETDDNIDNSNKGSAPVLLLNYKKEYRFKEREQVRLKCPIDLILSQSMQPNDDDYDYNNNLIIINWFDKTNNKIIPTFANSKRLIIENDIFLLIKNVNSNDAGVYRCEANNGFGTTSVNLTLNIISNTVQETDESIRVTTKASNIQIMAPTTMNRPKEGTPVFLDRILSEQKLIHKLKGDELILKCNIKKIPVKTDILWYKNSKILNEEDYGITRSKWVLSLKDLRNEDSGNYSCQVFNKYGYINATYEVHVYDETEIIESLDPVNSFVEAGQDAIFTCKVNNELVTSIQWLKQISRQEYDDYVSEKHQAELPNQQQKPLIDNKLNSFLNSFFVSSNYELNLKDKNENEKNAFEYLDGTHYITIRDGKQINKNLIINENNKIFYVDTLVVKNATKKESGIYICFAVTPTSYSYKKAYLNIHPQDLIYNETLIHINGHSIRLQSLLIIILPLCIICLFSIISIVYLRCIQTNQKKATKFEICAKLISKFFKLKSIKDDKNENKIKNFYLPVIQSESTPPPLPTSKPPSSSSLERHSNEYIHQKSDFINDGSQTKLITPSSNNTCSSLSSTSTYLTPLTKAPLDLVEQSIVYYKVLDCTLFENNEMGNEKVYNQNKKYKKRSLTRKQTKADSDSKTTISTATTNSRFYYQLNSENDMK